MPSPESSRVMSQSRFLFPGNCPEHHRLDAGNQPYADQTAQQKPDQVGEVRHRFLRHVGAVSERIDILFIKSRVVILGGQGHPGSVPAEHPVDGTAYLAVAHCPDPSAQHGFKSEIDEIKERQRHQKGQHPKEPPALLDEIVDCAHQQDIYDQIPGRVNHGVDCGADDLCL